MRLTDRGRSLITIFITIVFSVLLVWVSIATADGCWNGFEWVDDCAASAEQGGHHE